MERVLICCGVLQAEAVERVLRAATKANEIKARKMNCFRAFRFGMPCQPWIKSLRKVFRELVAWQVHLGWGLRGDESCPLFVRVTINQGTTLNLKYIAHLRTFALTHLPWRAVPGSCLYGSECRSSYSR